MESDGWAFVMVSQQKPSTLLFGKAMEMLGEGSGCLSALVPGFKFTPKPREKLFNIYITRQPLNMRPTHCTGVKRLL